MNPIWSPLTIAWTRSGTPVRSARGLGLAVPLLPARALEDDLEVGALRQLPRPDGVLLAVPADLGHHARRQLVLVVLVEADALVVDDELGGAHVGLARRLGDRRRIHRLRAIDGVGHPEQARDLAHRQLAHVLAAAVLPVDLVDLLPARPVVHEVDRRGIAPDPAGAAVRLLLRLEPRLV